MKHIFIVGSKGIPAQYGGFETFVENLTAGKVSEDIKYHVSCMDNEEKTFEHNGADCFGVRLPLPGAPGRILHVGLVMDKVCEWRKTHMEDDAAVYILGCRIGPLLIPYARKLHKLGIKIYCNPDGLEWKRDKWSPLAKKFLKYCEKCLVTNSDLIICDSVNIEEYIRKEYAGHIAETTFIAYGAHPGKSTCKKEKFREWCTQNGVRPNQYYLIVGRFVPENNYKAMISGFMQSNTSKHLVIVTNVEHNKFYQKLEEETNMNCDARIKFVGTVYDQELLKKIRENAYAYIHGHEVGGTNPSLLEALCSTDVNLLLNVGFNSEVGKDGALYWNKADLKKLIADADHMSPEERMELGIKAKERIKQDYTWKKICREYESVFLSKC